MNLKAIIFDLDDTLYDHRHSMLTGLQALQESYQCFAKPSLYEFEKEHIRLMNEVHLDKILKGELSLDEGRALRFQKAFEFYGVKADEKLSYEAAGIYRDNYVLANRLVPGAKELLERLKQNYKIGIVTNNLIHEQQRKLREGNITHLVDVMVTSEEAGVTKPSPEIFRMVLNRLEAMPGECIMVGDHWDVDIMGASALGIKCIWINVYDTQCPDPEIAVEVKSLEDTEMIFNLINKF